MVSRSTAHTEYGKIDELIIKKAEAAFISQNVIDSQWHQLNFTAPPHMELAISEYDTFESILNRYASTIHYLPADESVTIDSLYCRDSCLFTDHGMILCQMGKANRQTEPNAIRAYCQQHAIPILGVIEAPGTIEGGDLTWIKEDTLAVGHTYRTNAEGIRQLKHLLLPFDIHLIEADLPHFKGPADVFHLMSILSPVDRDMAVVYSPMMPVRFRNFLLDLDYHLIEVPDVEFDSMGCNVLALAPRICLMVSGNPITANALRSGGCTVFEYEGQEISLKGGGGPTCLTRPLKRSIKDSGFY
ncbi:MAG: arginine deiminase family protein [Saprospiraceae bacterium]|nr:arginine deiminase family protein [Saprospiraceae bacterium]